MAEDCFCFAVAVGRGDIVPIDAAFEGEIEDAARLRLRQARSERPAAKPQCGNVSTETRTHDGSHEAFPFRAANRHMKIGHSPASCQCRIDAESTGRKLSFIPRRAPPGFGG